MYTKKQSPICPCRVYHTYIRVSKREEIVRLRIKQRQRVKIHDRLVNQMIDGGKHKEEKKRKARTAKEMVRKKKSPSGLMQRRRVMEEELILLISSHSDPLD